MASIVKQKLARAMGGSDKEKEASQNEVDRYRLMVSAGPSYDQSTHQVVKVNTSEATVIENEFLTAKITVRVRGFRGLPKASPADSDYFEDPIHDKDLYSIAFSFVPKQDIPSVDTVWGNDFDHPIRDRIPPGFNTAFRIVKEFIDPGLSCDAYADEPWLYGPSLSCWFGFKVGDKYEPGQDFPAPDNVLKEGGDGSGEAARDALGVPASNDKRRKFFLNQSNREAFVFEKGRCYQGDFYNPYIDFGNFLLKLPGFSLKVIKYVEDKTHCLRYVFKDRNKGDVFFNVNFFLVWGEQLERAIAEDDKEHTDGQTGNLAKVLLPEAPASQASTQASAEAPSTAAASNAHNGLGLDEID